MWRRQTYSAVKIIIYLLLSPSDGLHGPSPHLDTSAFSDAGSFATTYEDSIVTSEHSRVVTGSGGVPLVSKLASIDLSMSGLKCYRLLLAEVQGSFLTVFPKLGHRF